MDNIEAYKALFDTSPDGGIVTDNLGNILLANHQAELLFGYRKEELIGQEIELLIPKRFHQKHIELRTDYVAKPSVREMEVKEVLWARRKDGSEFHVEIGLRPIKLGDSTFISATIRNITEREQLKDALHASEDKYRAIFENIQDVFYQTNLAGVIQEISPSIKYYSESSRDEIIGTPIYSHYYYPEDRPILINKLMKNGQLTDYELRIKTKSGAIQYASVNARIIFSPDGSPSHIEGTMRDITKRMQSEQALRESERFLKETQVIANLGTYTLDIGAGRWTSSDVLNSIFGIDSNYDTTFENWQTIVEPSWRKVMTDYFIDEVIGKKTKFDKEYKIIRINDKVERWVHGLGSLKLDDNNQPITMVGTIQDITERKKVEGELAKQFGELQKANQELDRFVYSVSHDLRAPLASILGLINISEIETDPAATLNYLDMIRSSVNRLDGFIKDILDYSRNARGEIQIGRVNFHELISETLGNVKWIRDADRLKISTEIEGSSDFYSDRARIAILVDNIVSNAIRFQDVQKELSILAIKIVISEENVFIRIFDNGIGIDGKYLDKVFDMFYRASEKAQGSGLGLYIVKETIAKLGGTIKVNSELGLSTTFEITIPNIPNSKH